MPPDSPTLRPLRMADAPLALPSGMRDLLPPRAGERRALARTVMTAFQRYGYDPIVPPAFERESVLARGLGARAERDLVRFLDPDTGEVLALRPDMTPQIARVIATRYRDVPPPLRLAYEGSVIRRPRGRSRRHRQVAQAGVECVGWPSLEADVEVILAALEALNATGLDDVQVELSHAALTSAVLAEVPDDVRDEVADALGRRDETAWNALLPSHPALRAELALLSSLAGGPEVIARARTELSAARHGRALDALDEVVRALRTAGLGDRLLVDLGELRGHGYYTGVFFQALCDGVGAPVASGGRYDELLGRYGAPMAATGCAIDLEALEDALSARGVSLADGSPTRVLVAGERTGRHAEAARLRADGHFVCEIDAVDEDAVRAYAQAHRCERATLCTTEGARAIEVGPRGDVDTPRGG